MTDSPLIRKASTYSNSTGATFIFGEPASGKTQLARDTLTEKSNNPLWVSFTNLNGIGEDGTEDWDVAEPSTWEDFYRHIYMPLSQGTLENDGIVIDGLHVLSQLALHNVAANRTKETISPQVSQNDWGVMGRLVSSTLVGIRSRVGNLIVIADVLPTEEGDDKVALNRDLFNRVIGQFSNKWYTYTQPIKTDGKVTGLDYLVEKTGAYAIRLRPSS